MLAKINAKKDERGFTLIELMIVIAIIGILAAIAIPQFNSYRKKSYNASAMSDVRNAATAQEAYFIDAQSYATAATSLSINTGQNVTLGSSGNANTYVITAYHSSGDKTYTLTGPGGNISSN